MESTKGHLVALVMRVLEKEYDVDLDDFGQPTAVEIEDRIPLLKAAPLLLGACQDFAKGWSHFCGCIDFGKSALDADAIRWMNEVPPKIGQAITKAENT